MNLHPQPICPPILEDLFETYTKTGNQYAENDKTRMLLCHILHLQEEVERAKYAEKCAVEACEKAEKHNTRLTSECVRVMNERDALRLLRSPGCASRKAGAA